ncbi:MAG: Glycosyltransferase/rhamnosyltransferase [Candidatus Woesebacteria bacterium GW2011_GWB1_38_5]|uniref:Glycosyltransferase/rhamnosyltransferase n=4 Tax=Patescibacteria group TaxID=1783273 RepID=A0A0G0KUC0_9BACT|nr:MAG: Glycosyl transferase family 2 [Candidatus Woesebacteria bacterium GW2011_GWC1_38_13]KKQ75535.1 MAG: Glycosyltransferase/rhamnosyltransferase [Candidatus Woesebacteria bacterium GW2011_GWB1_38_5]KKQ76082.1 MAG: Glycosyltransferase/rhamnosyltransferase [Microgenomates group bacterium GW2011_GWF1_38_5]KKQ83283.1 MAG: Glycosyltransferase/rhamnosyltransferase [Candidatus Woesebacteria bacterium GW2011_GWA1_38_8]
MKKPELSIIILNYNTRELLDGCLRSLEKVINEIYFEVVVIDNGSEDDSVEFVRKKYKWVKIFETGENLGFAIGNNFAKDIVNSEYVLFLNTDTVVPAGTLSGSLGYLKKHKLGALGCKLILPDGSLDKDARRSFITPWIGLVHLFLKLDRIFPRSKLFAKYWYGYIPDDKIHEVDALQGAFFLTTKNILDKVGWFEEDYFLDGEDIDLSWKIKNLGYKIVYYPEVSIVHIKGATKGKNRKSKKYISFNDKLKYRLSGVDSMEMFYRKRLWDRYSLILNYIVLIGIKALKFLRIIKLILFK